MPNTPATQEKSAIYRSTLRSIKEKFTRLEKTQIDAQEASDAGIQQGSLSLEDNSNYPYFFCPFMETLTPAKRPGYPIYNDTIEDYMNVKALSIYMQNYTAQAFRKGHPTPLGICYRAWGDFNFEALFEDLYFWSVSVTCPTPADTSLPHIKCLLDDDVTGDDRLTRGELISIINIMVGRMNTKSLRSHVIAPVMVYSIMGPEHLRVLEAYYNGKSLIVRKSSLYDMREYNPGQLDLLTRWWLGYAVGDATEVVNKLYC